MTVERGRFITFEGIEGAGKSTQMPHLVARLRSEGRVVLPTREPGGTELGERLRAVILDPDIPPMAAETELLLIFAARAEHLRRVIYPALASGTWVLCDRFTDASFAYQGAGRELGAQRVAELERWLQADFRPDLVLLFDVPVEVGLTRAQRRSDQDRIERETQNFFTRARDAYLQRAAADPQHYRVIDSLQPLDQVQAAMNTVWDEWMASHGRPA